MVRKAPGILAAILSRSSPGKECIVDEEEVRSWVEFEDFELRHNIIVLAEDGRWFRPVDTRRNLLDCIPSKRQVSAALTTAQSRQIVTAFYLLTVEKVEDESNRATHYASSSFSISKKGVHSRWYGPYDQEGEHVGNGDSFREFPA